MAKGSDGSANAYVAALQEFVLSRLVARQCSWTGSGVLWLLKCSVYLIR